MANFKVVISDPKTRKAYQKEIEQGASGLVGKVMGDKIKGDFTGLFGYELELTGGSDKEGFPMRKDVMGSGRKKIILSAGPGYNPIKKGQRKRKSIRGNTISKDIVQVNVKIVKHGPKSVEESFGLKKEEPKAEVKPAEVKKEEKPMAEEKKEHKEPQTEETKKEEPKAEVKKEHPKKEAKEE